MKIYGAGNWTRERRAEIATRLAAEGLLSQSLPRVRACFHLIRRVLNESAELLDRDLVSFPVLDPANHHTPAAKAASPKAPHRPAYRR